MKTIIAMIFSTFTASFVCASNHPITRDFRFPPRLQSLLSQFDEVATLTQQKKSFAIYMQFHPASVLDLRSGEKLKNSVSPLIIDASKMDGGHAMVGLSCQFPTERKEHFTAMTGETKGQAAELLKNGWGLNAFLAEFRDGRLQSREELHTLLFRLREKDLSLLIFEIENTDCVNGLDFITQFENHPSRPHTNFGVIQDPLQFQGAGCLSFAHAVLFSSGVFKNTLQFAFRDLRIPLRLLGRGNALPEHVHIPFWNHSPQRSVNILELLNSNWNVEPNDAYFNFRQLDPELLLLFFQRIVETIPTKDHQKFKLKKRWFVSIGSHDMTSEKVEIGYDEMNGNNSNFMELHLNQELRTYHLQKSVKKDFGAWQGAVLLRGSQK